MMKAYPVIVYHFPNSALGGIVMAKILITNPAHDDITHYLHVWSRQTIARAESGGHKVLKIERENVNRKNIEKFISRQKPELIVFHGHGTDDCIFGFGMKEVIVKSDDNEHHLKNKITHSITCSSAAGLGKAAIKKGGRAFIGFVQDFWCPYNPTFTSNPKKDIVARCNIEPVMRLSESLVKNNTVKESYKKSQECFKRWLDACQRSDAPPEFEGIAQFIHWNMMNQAVIGDGSSKLH